MKPFNFLTEWFVHVKVHVTLEPILVCQLWNYGITNNQGCNFQTDPLALAAFNRFNQIELPTNAI